MSVEHEHQSDQAVAMQTQPDDEGGSIATSLESAAEQAAVSADLNQDTDQDFGYQVSLKSFAGPLDLLLYLVRRNEVDITDIPVTAIADQFLETLQSWEDLDLDIAGDFILMATTLLEIKSRMVAPPPEVDEEETPDDEEDDLFDPRAN